jgi:hypothetical protein
VIEMVSAHAGWLHATAHISTRPADKWNCRRITASLVRLGGQGLEARRQSFAANPRRRFAAALTSLVAR